MFQKNAAGIVQAQMKAEHNPDICLTANLEIGLYYGQRR